VVVNDYTGIGTRVLAAADGRTLWKRDSGRWRPNYADPTSNVIYELDGSKLQAVDVHTGDVLASEQTGLGPDSRGISVVFGERTAVVLTNVEGASAAFAPDTLQPLWRRALPPHTLPQQESRFILVSNDDGDYGRIDAATGDRMWTHHPSGDYLNGTNFVTALGVIYFYGITKDSTTVRVEALDAETGEVRWTSVLPATNGANLLISDDVTYIHRQLDPPGTSFELTALDATSGEQLWSRPTPLALGSRTMAVDHGLIVAVSGAVELLR
jgi:outer membrane protein assembly factor BamB